MAKRLTSLLLALVLTGCAPDPTATLTPSPLRVVTTPTLEQVVVGWIEAYISQVHSQPFELETLPFDEAQRALQTGRGEILITSNEPPIGWFGASLRDEPIAIVVHPDTKVQNLSLDQLRRLFTGAEERWEEMGGGDQPVQVVIPPQGDELRRRFKQWVMRSETFDSDAYLAPSPEVARELIAGQDGAVGFIPFSLVSEVLSVVRVEGELPDAVSGNQNYPLLLPILAMSPQEPRGVLREWLLWLQGGEPQLSQ
jgi:hypothetical protein